MKKLILLGLLLASSSFANDKNQLVVLAGEGAQKGFTGNTRLVDRTGKAALLDGFKRGFVGGIQYQRQINCKVSLGIQAQTNDTYSFLFGVKF